MKRLLILFLAACASLQAAQSIRDLSLTGLLNRLRDGSILTVQDGAEIIIASGGKLTVLNGAIVTGITAEGGTTYTFTAADFNLSGTTVSIDYTNAQKASALVPGFMLAADKAKLDGIAANATANSSDAQLRDRSTHTGTQAISTISGLQAALDAGATFASLIAVNGSGPNSGTGRVHWSQLEGVPAGFADGTDDGPGGSSITFSLPLRKTGDDVSIDAATTSAPGSMSSADKSKLDGIASGATAGATWDSNITGQPTTISQAEAEAGVATTQRIWTSQRVAQAIAAQAAATGHSHSNATTGAAGFMSAADKTKLDGVEAGAQVNRAIASQAEAEAGSANDKAMTPLRVAQAIAALTPAGGDISSTGANTFLSGATVTFNAGTTLTINGTLSGTPTGGTLDLSNVTLSMGTLNVNTLVPGAITWGSNIVPSANGGAGTVNGIMKANGSGAVSQAVGGTDYEPARTTVSQSAAEAGTSTTVYAWTPERVAQAIAALSAGGTATPSGIGNLWPTASIGSPPTGYFSAGEYGTAGQTALGDWSIIVKSAGTVADPTVDIAPGAVPAGTVVTISSATPSTFSTVTNNGTDPTYTIGTVSSNFTVSGNGTWKYRSNKQGWISSAVQSATYTIDPVPTLTSAEINGTALTLTYSEAVSRGAGYANAHFDLDMSTTGSNIGVTYVSGDGTTTHTYTAASAAVNGETVDLDFSGAANSIEETAGYNQDVAAITSAAVTNSTPPGGGSPTFYYAAGWDSGASGGYTSSPDDVNFAGLSKVTLPAGGTATKLGIYLVFVNGSTALKMALFDSSRNLVGSGVSTTITSGDGQWHDITASITVPTSGTYYVGFSIDGPFNGSIQPKARSGSAGDVYVTYDSGSYTNFPSSLSGLSSSTDPFSVRVELTP